jgi:hypothetical protein
LTWELLIHQWSFVSIKPFDMGVVDTSVVFCDYQTFDMGVGTSMVLGFGTQVTVETCKPLGYILNHIALHVGVICMIHLSYKTYFFDWS